MRLRASSGSRYWRVVSMSLWPHHFLDGDNVATAFKEPGGGGKGQWKGSAFPRWNEKAGLQRDAIRSQ